MLTVGDPLIMFCKTIICKNANANVQTLNWNLIPDEVNVCLFTLNPRRDRCYSFEGFIKANTRVFLIIL